MRPDLKMLLYILSVDNQAHSDYRCYQRAVFAAFGMQRGGLLQMPSGARIRMRYVIDERPASAALEGEMAAHGDVLRLPGSATCLGKIIAAVKHLSSRSRRSFDVVLFSDDDAVIHPQRFFYDLAEQRPRDVPIVCADRGSNAR